MRKRGANGNRKYTFLAQAGLANKQRNWCLFSRFCCSESIHAEKAAGASRISGNRYLGGCPGSLRRLKAPKIGHLRESRGTSSNSELISDCARGAVAKSGAEGGGSEHRPKRCYAAASGGRQTVRTSRLNLPILTGACSGGSGSATKIVNGPNHLIPFMF